jgi:ketosteroid isomerase-like protein
MKKLLAVMVLTIVSFSISLGQTQKPAQKPDKVQPVGEKVSSNSSAEQELIQLDKQWGDAGLRGDAAALEVIVADDFMGDSPTGGAQTKAQHIADAKASAADITNATYTADEYTVRFLDPNTAVMTHRASEKGMKKGQEYTAQHRSMHVWVKRGGRWQVVASQATPIPQKSTP